MIAIDIKLLLVCSLTSETSKAIIFFFTLVLCISGFGPLLLSIEQQKAYIGMELKI